MALLFMDSFDHYITADLDKKWSVVNGAPVVNATGGRRSSGGVEFDTASEYLQYTFPSNLTTIITGVAIKVSALSVAQDVVKFMDSTSVQVKIRVRTDGKVEAFRDTTSLGVSASSVFSAATYAHLDIKVVINNSTGSVVVNNGGAAVLNLSSQDTQNTANAYATSVRYGGDGTDTVTIDDVYLCDSTGGVNDNLLGDSRVDAVTPALAGTYSDLTPSPAVANYLNVDDASPDGDSTYNSSSSVGARDSYGFTSLPDIGASNILGVQLNIIARKDAAGARKIRALARTAGTNYFGGSVDLTTSYLDYRQLYDLNPATLAAWAATEVDTMEFGVEIAN